MKKLTVLFLGIFLLAACAKNIRNQSVQIAVDWRGKNIEDYIQSNGIPTSQYSLSNGNTIYSFKKSCSYGPAEAETLVTAGEDNLIVKVASTSSCPSYQQSIEYKLDQLENKLEHDMWYIKNYLENK